MPILTALLPIVSGWLERLFPDPAERQKQLQSLIDAAAAADAAQMEVNKVEAANENVFVSGWRPFIGWVCGIAFAYKFIIQPFLVFILIANHSTIDLKTLPVLDWSEMSTVLLGLLGLGGMRSLEKIKGTK
jgi:hypothetical protein